LGFSLTSPDLDYRTHQRSRLKPARVPAALGQKFYALCEDIGLDFAAGDFMRDPAGHGHRFLEVNSQPMFAAFDQVSGGKLCDAIIDHLAKTPAEP
jgi:glutathione synthase/RimK-type ligase-like ATP-grasp enzyme